MTRQLRPFDPSEPGDSGRGLLRIPPNNPEVERAFLGAILLAPRGYDIVSGYLQPDHFTEAVNGRIYWAIGQLVDHNQTPNSLTLKTALERDDLLIAAGGFKYIAALSSSVVTTVNIAEYGRIIFDLHRRRQAIMLGEQLIDGAYETSGEIDPTTIIEETIGELADLNVQAGQNQGADLVNIIDEVMDQHRLLDQGTITGISSGLQSLDDQVGLLQDGDMVVVAGATSMGKSVLGLVTGYEAAVEFKAQADLAGTKPKWVLLFSGEMRRAQLASRLITALTGVPTPRQRKGILTEAQWAKLIDIRHQTQDLPLYIDDNTAPTISAVKARARQLRRRGGVGLIIVDYLQRMGIERNRRPENRSLEVGYLARGLKGVATEIGCPVFALSQINRGVNNRDDKRPHLSDLRESGDIENEADTVILLYREAYYLERSKPQGSAELMEWNSKLDGCKSTVEAIVAKSRHGEIGSVFLEWDGARTWIRDFEKALPQPEFGMGI